MKKRKRYSREVRERVLLACERASDPEVARILAKNRIPRTTYLSWKKRRAETGQSGAGSRGRPPSRIRSVVREEVDRGLRAYLGDKPERQK